MGGRISFQRDEGDIHNGELRLERQIGSGQVTRVESLDHDHARILPHLPVELVPPHVQRHHPRRAMLQQAVREPAGGGADVEAILAGHVQAERRERTFQFVAPTADETRPGLQFDGGIARKLVSGLVAGWPATRTSPAKIRRCACSLLSASPRATTRLSRRSFTAASFRRHASGVKRGFGRRQGNGRKPQRMIEKGPELIGVGVGIGVGIGVERKKAWR